MFTYVERTKSAVCALPEPVVALFWLMIVSLTRLVMQSEVQGKDDR